MVRRATLDRGVPRAGDDEALLADPAPAHSRRSAAKRSAARPRRGAGGRWLIWVARGVAWVVLLVIGYRGVTAIVTGTPASSPQARSAARPSSAFPTTLAQAYALQFGNVYLNFSPGTAARRASLLSNFLPAGSSSQLGWNGAGTQTLSSEQVASVQVQGAHTAIVTLLALINRDQLIELGVPLYAAGGQIVVTGEPALLPPPGQAAAPPAVTAGNSDPAAVAALQAQLPSFFRAYASGGQATLNRYLTPGARVTGLGGAFALGSVESVTAPFGGATRDITAVVIWRAGPAPVSPSATAAAPASLEMTYRMTVVREGTNWYVRSIGTSAESPGPP